MQRLVIVFISLCYSVSLAQGAANDSAVLKLHDVSDGIYAVEPTFAGANAAVIINDEFVTVVDSHGSPASAEALIDVVAGLTDKPIRYVINSHWHVDHHSGNEAYRAAWPEQVSIISHHSTREDIPTLGRQQFNDAAPYRTMPIEKAEEQLAANTAGGGQRLLESHRRQLAKFIDSQRKFVGRGEEFDFQLADLTIERHLTVHGNPHAIEVLHFHPAHTRGDLVVWLPTSRVLVAADILTKPILWTWSSYPRNYVRSLVAMEALDPEHVIIGHGGPVLRGTDYLVTAREFLEAVIDLVDDLPAEATDSVAQEAALASSAIRGFRERFGADVSEPMFEQMIAWTAARALLERRGEL